MCLKKLNVKFKLVNRIMEWVNQNAKQKYYVFKKQNQK